MKQESKKITMHEIIWNTVIFSIIGLIIETLFCYATTGVIECRKGLIWGPLCPVYGVGATVLITLLKQYKNSTIKLFLLGCILGNIVEYTLSYMLEAMYGTRFWDYSYIRLNLNGRICIKYSMFWGILAVLLIKLIEPPINKLINKIPQSKRKIIDIAVVTYLAIDCIATVWGIQAYQKRVDNQINKISKQQEGNIQKIKTKIEDTLFSNEKMKKTFPNLRYVDSTKQQHYIKEILEANE